MKRFALVIALLLVATLTVPAGAATVKYKNCAKLNAAYPTGVAKPGATDTKKVKGKKVAVTTSGVPTFDAAVYKKNKKLDRDKDGIACER